MVLNDTVVSNTITNATRVGAGGSARSGTCEGPDSGSRGLRGLDQLSVVGSGSRTGTSPTPVIVISRGGLLLWNGLPTPDAFINVINQQPAGDYLARPVRLTGTCPGSHAQSVSTPPRPTAGDGPPASTGSTGPWLRRLAAQDHHRSARAGRTHAISDQSAHAAAQLPGTLIHRRPTVLPAGNRTHRRHGLGVMGRNLARKTPGCQRDDRGDRRRPDPAGADPARERQPPVVTDMKKSASRVTVPKRHAGRERARPAEPNPYGQPDDLSQGRRPGPDPGMASRPSGRIPPGRSDGPAMTHGSSSQRPATAAGSSPVCRA